MKTYKIDKKTSAKAKAELERIVDTHEEKKNAYFFKPAQNAPGRRRNEENFEKQNPDVRFITKQGDLIVKLRYSESCNNVYYTANIWLNDEVKDIRAVKKLIKE